MEAPSFEVAEPFAVQVPRLRTKRLLLREFRAGDFDGYAAFMTDPVATTFLAGVADRRNAWRSFSSGAGSWALHERGWWMCESLETGEVTGTVGSFLREGYPDLELGWTVYPKFWRQGLGAEASLAARDYSFRTWGARRLVAHISNGNTASEGVARKIGMVSEGQADFYGSMLGRWAIEI